MKTPRKGEVQVNGIPAGVLDETATGIRFQYYPEYVRRDDLPAVSLTLPRQADPFESSILFPFFAGLLAEGATMQIQCRRLKLDEADLLGRLLKTATSDVVGNVTVHDIAENVL